MTIVGTGATVGMPTAVLLMNLRDSLGLQCSDGAEKASELCRESDIIISAAGKAGLIGREYVRPARS